MNLVTLAQMASHAISALMVSFQTIFPSAKAFVSSATVLSTWKQILAKLA